MGLRACVLAWACVWASVCVHTAAGYVLDVVDLDPVWLAENLDRIASPHLARPKFTEGRCPNMVRNENSRLFYAEPHEGPFTPGKPRVNRAAAPEGAPSAQPSDSPTVAPRLSYTKYTGSQGRVSRQLNYDRLVPVEVQKKLEAYVYKTPNDITDDTKCGLFCLTDDDCGYRRKCCETPCGFGCYDAVYDTEKSPETTDSPNEKLTEKAKNSTDAKKITNAIKDENSPVKLSINIPHTVAKNLTKTDTEMKNTITTTKGPFKKADKKKDLIKEENTSIRVTKLKPVLTTVRGKPQDSQNGDKQVVNRKKTGVNSRRTNATRVKAHSSTNAAESSSVLGGFYGGLYGGLQSVLDRTYALLFT